MARTPYKKRPIADLKREPKKEVKPIHTRYTMESLAALSTEELYALGTSVKNDPKEETLQVAIVTILGRRAIHNPTF